MRRLTLILSDLYLPTEFGPTDAAHGGGLPAALDLPNLDWLLRFAVRAERIHDWRSWLSTDLGAANIARMPVAQVCAVGLLPDPPPGNAWLATPVHLEARLDHVRLADRGLLRLRAEQREILSSEFARSFGPEYALHDAGERSFLLTGTTKARVASVDPARLLDADIGHALPSVPAAGELRRLGTEIEMWLHGATANTVRERLRERRISALWLWGGGDSDDISRFPQGAGPSERVLFHGGDPFLVALANLAGRFNRAVPSPVLPAPPSLAALEGSANRIVVELTPMSGPGTESLAVLDAGWFSPARDALNGGRLDSVDLIANDRWFRIKPSASWRIWRRRSPWLAQLGRHLPDAKA
jgi:hypothetical protein